MEKNDSQGTSSPYIVDVVSLSDQSKKRTENWSDGEVNALLELWKENLPQLRGQRRNSHIYNKMSTQLADLGIQRGAAEIKNKILNLTKIYRREKRKMTSGSSPSTWKYWNDVHSVIGILPCNDDGKIVESLNDIENITTNIFNDTQDLENSFVLSQQNESLIRQQNTFSVTDCSQECTRKGKKRSRNSIELEKLNILKEMFEEQKRSNREAEDTDKKLIALLGEQTEAQKKLNSILCNQNVQK